VVFASIDLVMRLIKRAKTEKGIRVAVNLIKTVYKTGRKVCESFKRICPLYSTIFCPSGFTALSHKMPDCLSYLIFIPKSCKPL
jgi:hypothetical protein